MALNREQLSRLEQALDQNYRRLLDEVRDELEASDSQQYAELVNRDPTDTGDAAIADLLAHINLTAIDRHIVEIRDIDAARGRINEGTFNRCIDCGKEIGFERLLAYATAKRCLECQQLHERLYASGATPTL